MILVAICVCIHCIQGKTNFFEKRVGEYSKSGVGVEKSEQQFTLEADF